MSMAKDYTMEKQPACSTKSLSNYFPEDHPDPAKWDDCVHCGMCLEACPTYLETGQEQHSPRGRVHLIHAVAEGEIKMDQSFSDAVFTCLDCRACVTACPADVEVGGLIEEARGQIRRAEPLTGWKKAFSSTILEKLFPHTNRLNKVGGLLRFYQTSGLQSLTRKSGAMNLMPDHLSGMEAIMPNVGHPVREKYKNMPVIPAKGDEVKGRVAFMTGCIMDVMFSDINDATIDVLTHNGSEVVIPKNQTCCGALHVHAGDRDSGRKLAKQNIEAFSDSDTVVINSAGCGCALQEYPELFKDEPEWKEKAEEFSEKIQDISKYLYDTGYEKPQTEMKTRITYHDACHLAHGQGVREEPRQILRDIPGVEVVDMPNADTCCGSAGVYNLTNPDMANAVLDRKMENIPENLEMISMGNPGCMLQMAMGVQKYGRSERIVHTIQLLDWAYKKQKEEQRQLQTSGKG
ncbi:glycolate oxidase iron-sulfur subunit [Sinobaca qinghaiensis]|uniref:Glycolate oxidase iron-sulfur subunit n=1 Tax=Sinobaca qinghaiensis TaxID=342944 RepID=A0A419V4M4_9BACL|nr:(Fe-S)-binding protein [Sinobaca qinghaiensis]RKD73467.1 glycolate oxidase iron-sulfur subunit [Sinobaca qinghaiensis]